MGNNITQAIVLKFLVHAHAPTQLVVDPSMKLVSLLFLILQFIE